MASDTKSPLQGWMDCFTKAGERNQAIMREFLRASHEKTLAFTQRRLERRTEMASRLKRDSLELLALQQDFFREALGDWADYTATLSELTWQTAENRMKQASQTVAAIVPFSRGTKRDDERAAA